MKWIQRLLYSAAFFCLLCVAFYRLWFLRQPQRNIPHNPTEFVSPANGKVVSVRHWNTTDIVETKGELGAIHLWTNEVDTAGTIISIQMNPLNVHYQRAPQNGKLLSEKYTKGSFHNAVSMSNDYGIRFENEHNEMLFETTSGKRYKVIQIAGFLARRIVDYMNTNQTVSQGEIIGLIKLGSQVTVILPHNVTVTTQVGDIVTDGETVLGKE